MAITTIRRLIFILTLTVIGVACSDTGTGIEGEQDPATVEGRVDQASSGSEKSKVQGIEGAAVTAARITSDGSLQAIGGAETETDAQGAFTLSIPGEAVANASDRIVIIAEQNGNTTKAFVASEVTSGSTVGVQPLTIESSSETDVYQEVIANGDVETVTKADIEVAVNTEVATDIENNSRQAAEVAGSLAAHAEAKAEFYSEQAVQVTEEQQEEVRQIRADAQVELENQLNAASSTEEEEAAFKAFVETMARAELNAGIKASAVAKSSEYAFRALMNESTDLSTEAQAEIRRHYAYMLAFALDEAVQAEFRAAGASEATIEAAADAAVTLRSEIQGMIDASASAVESAYAEYNSEIEALASEDNSLEGEVVVTANAEINTENGAKATLESELQGLIDLGLMMNAYTQFYSSVESTVGSQLSNTTEAEAEAYTQLLILINLAN